MNILYVHFHEEIGGGEKYFINIINKLPEYYNIFLLTPNKKATIASLIEKKYQKISKKFITNIGPIPLFSFSLFYEVSKYIIKAEINVIHFSDHNMVPTMILLKKIFNIKIVFTSHGRWDVHFLFNKILLKILNPVVIVSTHIHYFRIIEFVNNIKLIPMIVQEPRQIIEKDICNRKIKLGIVGRFSPVKNHKLAITILSQLDPTLYELHIYGDQTLNIGEESDAYRKEVYQLIRINNNVIHHGIVHDQDKVYNNIDILLQTSLTEASSLVTVEAQKYAIPLVCSLTEASSYAVLDDYNGFICTTKSEYIKSIQKIKDNYKAYSENSFNNSKRFSANSYIMGLVRIYEN